MPYTPPKSELLPFPVKSAYPALALLALGVLFRVEHMNIVPHGITPVLFAATSFSIAAVELFVRSAKQETAIIVFAIALESWFRVFSH